MQINNKSWWFSIFLLAALSYNLQSAFGANAKHEYYDTYAASQAAQKQEDNRWRGGVIGFTYGLCPFFGTGKVMYSSYASPLFSYFDAHEHSTEYQSASFTEGLIKGHVSGLIVYSVAVAALCKKYGPESLFWSFALPWAAALAQHFPGRPS